MTIAGWTKEHLHGVCVIGFRADGDSSISIEIYRNLIREIIQEAHNPRIGAVLLHGEPDRFCFGMNINELQLLRTDYATRGTTSVVQDLLTELETAPAALVCAIDGPCLGGGLELALTFHILMATPSSSFGLPEVRLGTIPSFGGTQRLARVIGRQRALNAILTGDLFSAEDAHRWGLLRAVLPREKLMSEALRTAEHIARLSRGAVEAVVTAVTRGLDGSLQEGLALESRLSSRLAGGADLEEGIAAFLSRRRPQFPSVSEG